MPLDDVTLTTADKPEYARPHKYRLPVEEVQ